MISETEKLLPCPFCGSTDIRYHATGGGHRFRCRYCRTDGPVGRALKGVSAQETSRLRTDDAFRLWNKRYGSNQATKTPEATVKGEADGTLPRTASPAVPLDNGRYYYQTESQPAATGEPPLSAGTEGDADRQPNSNPATTSPPETGGDAAPSSLASSPNNSPAALLSAGEGTHPTDDKERGDAVRGKGSPDGEVHMAVKSPHGAHESDDFDPVRDMPAHLRDRPWAKKEGQHG